MNKTYLIILDGYGSAPDSEGNAVSRAHTPYLDELLTPQKISLLKTHGEAVGLPSFQMGGSEVGHTTIGAGRPVKHILTKINDEIEDESFFEKNNLKSLFKKAQTKNRIHFLGLCSDGGIHSFLPHLFGLGKMAKKFGIQDVNIHAFLDGRDVPERTAKMYLNDIKSNDVGKIASLGGRFYGMDRDHNWERTQAAYEVMTNKHTAITAQSPNEIIDSFYQDSEKSDYYLPTHCLDKNGQIREDDIVICFNFRPDRMRQIMSVFCDKSFDLFARPFVMNPQNFGVFGNYYEDANTIFSLSSEPINNTLGQVLSDNNLTQLRAAETEKFNHVTFFFSGEKKNLFPGEERILVDSPKVPIYSEAPAMSAVELTDQILKKLETTEFDFVIHNYANGDLVGHSGDLPASIKAVETLEQETKRLVPTLLEKGYHVIITADHGNCEEMLFPDGSPSPCHSKNLVPFRILNPTGEDIYLKTNGELADIAPTICEIMNIKKPKEMSGESLISP